jgi:hypothetical protein
VLFQFNDDDDDANDDPNDFTKMKASEKILACEPSESGHKDVVKAFPNTITQIAVNIGPYQGKYPLHCHILEHEDHEMMRQYRMMHANESKKCIIRSASECGNGVCEAGNGENCKNCPRMYSSLLVIVLLLLFFLLLFLVLFLLHSPVLLIILQISEDCPKYDQKCCGNKYASVALKPNTCDVIIPGEEVHSPERLYGVIYLGRNDTCRTGLV